MTTKDMRTWETGISRVVSTDKTDEVIVRGHPLSELIGRVTFAEMMFLMLQGSLPTKPQARVLDALLVASAEHGIAPPSMISRCFASYGTSIQAAVGGGVLAFGDRMGGLGEQLARLMAERLATRETAPAEIDDQSLRAEARALVRETQKAGRRVPGYGIPLHGTDPRAPAVLAIAKQEGAYGAYCRFATLIEEELAAARAGRAVPMNLDGVGAAVILDLGFSWRSARMFLITPRTVSMGAHYLEEQEQDTTWRHIPADEIDYTI
jgi:citrate synthase